MTNPFKRPQVFKNFVTDQTEIYVPAFLWLQMRDDHWKFRFFFFSFVQTPPINNKPIDSDFEVYEAIKTSAETSAETNQDVASDLIGAIKEIWLASDNIRQTTSIKMIGRSINESLERRNILALIRHEHRKTMNWLVFPQNLIILLLLLRMNKPLFVLNIDLLLSRLLLPLLPISKTPPPPVFLPSRLNQFNKLI